MTQMMVFEHKGAVLVYDTDDVAHVKLTASHDVIDVSGPEDTARRLELGQAHLRLNIDFKPGKGVRWVDRAELEA